MGRGILQQGSWLSTEELFRRGDLAVVGVDENLELLWASPAAVRLFGTRYGQLPDLVNRRTRRRWRRSWTGSPPPVAARCESAAPSRWKAPLTGESIWSVGTCAKWTASAA